MTELEFLQNADLESDAITWKFTKKIDNGDGTAEYIYDMGRGWAKVNCWESILGKVARVLHIYWDGTIFTFFPRRGNFFWVELKK